MIQGFELLKILLTSIQPEVSLSWSHLNPIHTLSETHFNIILLCLSVSSESSLHSTVSD
jgi:hypothetical protein